MAVAIVHVEHDVNIGAPISNINDVVRRNVHALFEFLEKIGQ